MANNAGVLILEDGAKFEGALMGTPVSAASIREAARSADPTHRDRGYGEAVFNTSMTGYQEILTDPSYYGQVICMTVPHVGNTGVNEQDPESRRAWCAGFVVQELAERPSNWRSTGDLDTYLKKEQIPGLMGVDTRALTRHLRSKGVARALILPASELKHATQLFAELPPFEGRDLIGEVTVREPRVYKSTASATSSPRRVVALDFGIKLNLIRSLNELGCDVEVMPAQTPAREVLARKPQGVFLSNGPGDPSAAPYAADTVRDLLGRVPIFGVCMGHQILGIALGAKTYKLKFGHRGGNQPVQDQESGKVEISSHNHGYAVDRASLPPEAVVTHVCLNDQTVEGMMVPGSRAFSVQYHPEACPGPHDSAHLFQRFVEMMN